MVCSQLEWAGVGPGDVLYELGCGDGRVAIEAALLGAQARQTHTSVRCRTPPQNTGAQVVCVEMDPEMAVEARRAIRAAGVEASVDVREENLLETNLSNASVVYLFLLPSMNAQLLPALAHLRHGARVLSQQFQARPPCLLCGPTRRWVCSRPRCVGSRLALRRATIIARLRFSQMADSCFEDEHGRWSLWRVC